MSLEKKYQAEWERYKQLAARAAKGDSAAKSEKQKPFNECRQMERAAAREAQILLEGKDITAAVTKENRGSEPQSKRDLQKAMLQTFDGEAEGLLPEKAGGEPVKTTLRAWHKKRLKL